MSDCCPLGYLLHMQKQKRSTIPLAYSQTFKHLALFCDCPDRFMLNLVGKPEDWFSHDATHIISSGACIDHWMNRSCSCASGFVGEKCALQNMAHFTSGSFLHFGNYTEIQALSLWLSTNGSSGVILYTVSIPHKNSIRFKCIT